jgi:hypothetical protein
MIHNLQNIKVSVILTSRGISSSTPPGFPPCYCHLLLDLEMQKKKKSENEKAIMGFVLLFCLEIPNYHSNFLLLLPPFPTM